MKIAAIVAASIASVAAHNYQRSCQDVSVEGDATYCIDGPICSGSGDQPAGWNCPQCGDIAVDACHGALSSYDYSSDLCVAPKNAVCKKIHTGAWGCVWEGQYQAKHHHRHHGGCTDVSVKGDATYCVSGSVCSGSGDQPAGWSCPKKGDYASMDCHSGLSSYLNNDQWCKAPKDAECKKIETGAWGCVWKGNYEHHHHHHRHHEGCTEVSVKGDATYCVTGSVCSGSGDQPAGWSCPKKGDWAKTSCRSGLSSYRNADGWCQAPKDAECKKIETGAWGCVWKGEYQEKHHLKRHHSSCTEVSVEGDATYCVEGAVCSGSGDQPAGWECPKKGAMASNDCYDHLNSYSYEKDMCFAPTNAKCEKIHTGAWGCVWKW